MAPGRGSQGFAPVGTEKYGTANVAGFEVEHFKTVRRAQTASPTLTHFACLKSLASFAARSIAPGARWVDVRGGSRRES